MGLFEFFFPQWAAAEHLREISEQKKRPLWTEERRSVPPPSVQQRLIEQSTDQNRRIRTLEEDVGFVSLVLLGILERLDEKGVVAKRDVLEVMRDLDALDGAVDGRINIQVLRNLARAGPGTEEPHAGGA